MRVPDTEEAPKYYRREVRNDWNQHLEKKTEFPIILASNREKELSIAVVYKVKTRQIKINIGKESFNR